MTTYISATPDQGICCHISGVVTCNPADIPYGGQSNIQIVNSTTEAGMLNNTVSLSSHTSAPYPSNNNDSELTNVELLLTIKCTCL